MDPRHVPEVIPGSGTAVTGFGPAAVRCARRVRHPVAGLFRPAFRWRPSLAFQLARVLLAAAVAISTVRAAPAESPQPARFDAALLDWSKDPCTDFYAFACSKWLAFREAFSCAVGTPMVRASPCRVW